MSEVEEISGIDSAMSSDMVDMTGLEDIEKTIVKISGSACSILVLGETGTGKEIIARRIHEKSNRSSEPFVAVNIGGVDDGLLSSELFGHTKGAFTGAQGLREGQFAHAESGTIYLDEIGELAAASQVKLLRILQDSKYFPIGSDKSKSTNARVIAATNADIPKALSEKKFREDLLYRFKLRIKIPSLRERGDEAIKRLAKIFVLKFGLGKKALSKEAIVWLCSKERSWPGNVRQLESVLEMACLLTNHDEIMPSDLINVYYDDQVETLAIEPLNDKSDIFHGNKEIYTKEKQREIVVMILLVYPRRRANVVFSPESRTDVLRALVKTLETGQILLYSEVKSMTDLNLLAVMNRLKGLQNIIKNEESLRFIFECNELGVRLIPKDQD